MCPIYEQPQRTNVIEPTMTGPLRLADGYRCYGLPKQASERSKESGEVNASHGDASQSRERGPETTQDHKQQGPAS